jgi:hypothetical protein
MFYGSATHYFHIQEDAERKFWTFLLMIFLETQKMDDTNKINFNERNFIFDMMTGFYTFIFIISILQFSLDFVAKRR